MLRGVPPPDIPPETGAVSDRAAAGITAAVQEEHSHALALLTTAGLTAYGIAGVKAVFSRARRAVSRITAGVAVAVTSAAAHAALVVARYLGPGVRMLWVAEPGACPACAAYAGRSIRPGSHFPGGISLDPQRTVFLTSIPGPPRHPHCRCVLIPWHPNWRTNGPSLPVLLQRRARAGTRIRVPAQRTA